MRKPSLTSSGFLEADFRIGEWSIHPKLNLIVRANRSIKIEPKVMEVLACLAEQAGQVIPKETIIQRVWIDTFVTDDVLIRAISELRRAFEDDRRNPSVIRTISRRGYQLVGPVALLDEGVLPGNGNGGSLSRGSGGHSRNGQGKVSANEGSHALLSAASNHSAVEFKTRSNREPAHVSGVKTEVVSVLYARSPLQSGQKHTVFRKVFGAISFLLILFLAYCWYEASLVAPRVTRIVQLTDTGRPKGGLANVGSRIFFSEYRDGHSVLASVSVNGGDTVAIECPFQDVRLLDISPDGIDLLVSELSSPGMEKPVWFMPAYGGKPRRLGNVHVYHTSGAAWSPKGDRIAYSALSEPVENLGEAAIYLVGTDGMNPQKLLTTPSPVYQILWSPDGSVLRYSLGNNRWGEVSSDGSNPQLLLAGWQDSPLQNRESSGTWTPDGKYFFFTSQREGLQHLWAIKEKSFLGGLNGAAPLRFTPGPFDVDQPLTSRDGGRIFCKGGSPRAELSRYVRETRTLEPYLSGISAEMPDFSKDGQWTVYVTLPEASLVRSRIDGRDRIQLTSPPLQATLPTWSPDGEEIAFMARMPGEQEFGIYLVSASGSNLRRLQPGLGPSWSPDGRYLLFEQWDPSNPDSFKILDLKTNQVSAVPASENKTAPRWSPDGRYIAATADGWSRVVVFDSETRVWRTLATYRGGLEEHECRKGSGDGVFFPTWSHDGQSIFYVDWTPGKAGIYRVALAGDEPETIIYFADPRTPPHRFYSGTLGGWFGLAPDDSLLFAVHASEEEIYAIEWEEG